MRNQWFEEPVQPIAARWAAAREWAEHLLAQMTPAEKVGQLNQVSVEPSPLFPFGFGKSYSEFRYQNLSAEVIGLGDDLVVSLQVEIQNLSQRAGRETIQIYMRDPVARVARPVRELVAFKKIDLQAGETKSVEFSLGSADLSYHDGTERFVEPGLFQFYVGGDSDASLSVEIQLTPEQLAVEGQWLTR